MKVEPLTVAHLEAVALQPAQAMWRNNLTRDDYLALTTAGQGWAGIHDGRVLACVGVLERGPNVGDGWGLIAGDLGRLMPTLTRAVRRGLEATPYRRIEIRVASNFPQARRWATMLGFCFEGVCRAYCEDGTDAELWSLVRI